MAKAGPFGPARRLRAAVHTPADTARGGTASIGGEDILARVRAHLASVLGQPVGTYAEIVPGGAFPIDLDLFPPRPGRDFWVVATVGLSQQPMTVADVDNAWYWRRAELIVALPADWPGLSETEGVVGGETYFHPLRILRKLAHFPHAAGTAIAPSHTLMLDEPLGPDSAMQSVLIVWPDYLGEDETTLPLGPAESVVNIYAVLPLHEAEREFAVTHGSHKLYELLLNAGATELYDISRPPVAGVA